jgi:broad specificity phosphatase PhoE
MPVTKDFYLIRHAESLANAGLNFGMDTPLSPTGRAQAGHCAEFLSGHVVPDRTLLLSSPFRRAVQTADFIAARHNLDIRLEPALHELFLADWIDLESITLLPMPKLAGLFPRVVGPCPDGPWWPAKSETDDDAVRRATGLRNRLLGREFPQTNIV